MKFVVVVCLLAVFVAVQSKNLHGIQIPKSSAVTLNNYYAKHPSESRIINGELATRGQFPHQAVLYMYMNAGGRSVCGGSLISSRWVLTAAHCVDKVLYWDIKLGKIQLDIYEPEQVMIRSNLGFIHPNYNSLLNNDIGLIRSHSQIPLNEYVNVIRLPRLADANNALTDIDVTFSGWGKKSDAEISETNNLNWVNLTTISNEECAKYHHESETVISSTLCCRGHPDHSPCNGDSGGPLIRTESDGQITQVGIASFVSDDGCESGKPSGFVRTASYLKWISQHTGIEIRP